MASPKFDFTAALPLIETSNIRLRQLRRSDVVDVFAIFSDPDVMKYWSREPLASLTDAHALLDAIESGRLQQRLLQWGVTLHDTDQVIGTTTIFAWDREHRRAELGFALRRNYWRRGLGHEAARTIVDFAFRELHLNRLEADPDPRNEASLRILKRLGFREEGYLRERYLLGGEPQDAILMALLRAEWITTTTVAP